MPALHLRQTARLSIQMKYTGWLIGRCQLACPQTSHSSVLHSLIHSHISVKSCLLPHRVPQFFSPFIYKDYSFLIFMFQAYFYCIWKSRQHCIGFFCIYVGEIHWIFGWTSFIGLGNFLATVSSDIVYHSVLLLVPLRLHVHTYLLMLLMHYGFFVCLMWVWLLLLLFPLFWDRVLLGRASWLRARRDHCLCWACTTTPSPSEACPAWSFHLCSLCSSFQDFWHLLFCIVFSLGLI